jgi:hypothetical protein
MAKFPHEITMAQYGLSENDLSEEATEALDDFNSYLEDLQEKKEEAQSNGEQFTLSEAQKRKINRLSEAVSSAVEDMVDGDDDDEPQSKSEGGFDLFAWMK